MLRLGFVSLMSLVLLGFGLSCKTRSGPARPVPEEPLLSPGKLSSLEWQSVETMSLRRLTNNATEEFYFWSAAAANLSLNRKVKSQAGLAEETQLSRSTSVDDMQMLMEQIRGFDWIEDQVDQKPEDACGRSNAVPEALMELTVREPTGNLIALTLPSERARATLCGDAYVRDADFEFVWQELSKRFTP